MAQPPETTGELETLVRSLRIDAATFVSRPLSTLVPERLEAPSGRRALEVLQGLPRVPGELVDEGPLGTGGMGVVGLATQVSLGRKVAVKRLRADRQLPRHVEALLAEARLSGSLEHPNIVPVHDLSLDAQGLPVLVMKRIEGVPWSTLIRDEAAMARHAPGRPPLDEHLRIFSQVCHALHFAHSRGVVHRDLKPDNVMVGAFGEVAVVDWGIASNAGPVTEMAGTPAYMAPEMLGSSPAGLSARTDVYLLGATLFHLLTGRPPHHGETFEVLARRILSSPVELPASVPAELAELVRRCMAVDPAARPESAQAVRLAVEAFLEHQGSLELARQASARLAELTALVATPGPDLRRVFDVFSECRFGFQQALREWAGNAEAHAGLRQTVQAMVRFELARGSASSAQALLGELHPVDAELEAEVAQALARDAQKAQRLAALEKAHDPLTGNTARSGVAIVVGLVWVLAPLLRVLQGAVPPGREMLVSVPVALLTAALLAGLGYRYREYGTPLNRQIWRVVLLTLVVQAAALSGYFLLVGDLGPLVVPILCAYWGFVSAVITVSMVPGNWPPVLGFLVGTWASLRWPEYRYHVTSAVNAVFALNSAWLLRGKAW